MSRFWNAIKRQSQEARAASSALVKAAAQGDTETVLALLDQGAEVNAYDWMGRTAYMLAEGFPEIAALLREHGAKTEPPENW